MPMLKIFFSYISQIFWFQKNSCWMSNKKNYEISTELEKSYNEFLYSLL